MWVPVVVVIVVALLILTVVGVWNIKPTQQTTLVPGQTTGNGGTTSIVTTNPAIQVAGSDAQASGTTVGSTAKASINDGGYTAITLGTTTAVPGQRVKLFLTNGTAYHNKYVEVNNNQPIDVSTFPVSVGFNKNATVTENIFNTVAAVITNGGGVNQTALGAGSTYNLKDEMTANALTSTQDMVCIIEITNGTCVDTTAGVKYGGQAAFSTSKPTWYSVVGGNSAVYLFNMPALSTTATATNTISVASKGTSCDFTAGSRLIKTCYTKEWSIDPNSGQAIYDIQDSNGNLESMASYGYTVYFQ